MLVSRRSSECGLTTQATVHDFRQVQIQALQGHPAPGTKELSGSNHWQQRIADVPSSPTDLGNKDLREAPLR